MSFPTTIIAEVTADCQCFDVPKPDVVGARLATLTGGAARGGNVMTGQLQGFVCRHTGLLRGLAVVLLLGAGFLLVRTLPVSQPVEWLRDQVGALGAWGPT